MPRSAGSLSSSHSVLSAVTTSEEEVQAIAGSIGVDYESLARELEAAERLNQLEMEDEVTAVMMKGGDAMTTVGMATKQESTDADVESGKRDGKSMGRSSSVRYVVGGGDSVYSPLQGVSVFLQFAPVHTCGADVFYSQEWRSDIGGGQAVCGGLQPLAVGVPRAAVCSG